MSKFRLINVLILTALMMIVSHEVAFAQEKSVKPKLKSIVVMEEKHDGASIKTYKESEVKYDMKGNIIEELIFKEGDFVSHFVYEYDAENNKIKETEFDKSGKVDKVSVYKYENGMRVEKCVYDNKGNLKTKKTYKYSTF